MADKRVNELIRQVEGWPGWRVVETRKGYMLYPPDKSLSGVLVHRSPSDTRWLKNVTSELRKRGAPL